MFSPSTLFIYPEKKPVDREWCFSTAGTFLYVLTILLFFFFHSSSPSRMGGPTRHCQPSFSQRVVGWYFWCEWCYLFLHPGRLVIKAHANPNLGQNLKLEIQGPSQVSTLFTNRLSLLVPTHSYYSQKPACLGRPNLPVSGRKNSSVFPWPHLASFWPAHSAALGQVAFKLHIHPHPAQRLSLLSFPCSDFRCD